jgi:hypothetical protein
MCDANIKDFAYVLWFDFSSSPTVNYGQLRV